MTEFLPEESDYFHHCKTYRFIKNYWSPFWKHSLTCFCPFYEKILDILCEAIYFNCIYIMHCLYYFIYFLTDTIVCRKDSIHVPFSSYNCFVVFFVLFLQKFCVQYYMPARQTNMFCPIKRTNIQLT